MGLVKGQSMKVQLLMQIYFNREQIEYMNENIEETRVPIRVDSSMSKIWRRYRYWHYILYVDIPIRGMVNSFVIPSRYLRWSSKGGCMEDLMMLS